MFCQKSFWVRIIKDFYPLILPHGDPRHSAVGISLLVRSVPSMKYCTDHPLPSSIVLTIFLHRVLYWPVELSAVLLFMIALCYLLSYFFVGKHWYFFFLLVKSSFILSTVRLIFTSWSFCRYFGRQEAPFFCQHTPASSFGWWTEEWFFLLPHIWLSCLLWNVP